MADTQEYLKASEVAEKLRVDKSTVVRLVQKKLLPAVRFKSGKKSLIRIPSLALERFLKKQIEG